MNRYRKIEAPQSREEVLRRFLSGELAAPDVPLSTIDPWHRRWRGPAKLILCALGLGAAAGAVPLLFWIFS